MNVLLIEDDRGYARYVQQMLKRISGNVFEAVLREDLQSGLKRLREGDIDCILLDLSLPDSSKIETFRAVEREKALVPIIILSGHRDEDLALEAVREGAQDYLVKDDINGSMLSRVMRYSMERARIEKELLLAKEQAEAANCAKDTFLTNMSHELRTPLTGVLSTAELLLLSTELDDDQKRFLEIIQSSGQALLNIISDLLDMSSIESGRRILGYGELDVREVVNTIVAGVSADADGKHIRVQVEVEPSVPDRVHCDPTCVLQILTNLIGNAVKFTERGTVIVGARLVKDHNADHKLQLEITDTGIGIAESERERIFEDFYQIDGSHTRQYEGLGLGLSIVRRLAGLLGATIRVSSQLQEGSRFSVEIPVDVPQVG